MLAFPLTFDGAYQAGNGTVSVVYEGPELLLDRNAFNGAAWSSPNVTIVADTAAAPDGTITADKLTQTAQFATPRQTYTVNPVGKRFTFGVWLRADTPHNAQVELHNSDFTSPDTNWTVVSVTTAWQYFQASTLFTLSKPSINVGVQPTENSTTFTPVYAWGASLVEEVVASTFPFSVPAGRVLKVSATGVIGEKVYTLYGGQSP